MQSVADETNTLALVLKRRGRKPAEPFVINRKRNPLEQLIDTLKHQVSKHDKFKFDREEYSIGDDVLIVNFDEPEYPNVGKLHAIRFVTLEEDCKDHETDLKSGNSFPALEIRW